MRSPFATSLLCVTLSALAASAAPAREVPTEHRELEATLKAPFRGNADDSRQFGLAFQYPGEQAVGVNWRVQLLGPQGRVLRQWSGTATTGDTRTRQSLHWDGLDSHGKRLPAGHYVVQLAAIAGSASDLARGVAAASVDSLLQARVELPVIHEWDVQAGELPRPVMPAFKGLPHARAVGALRAPAQTSGTLPYTVYMGNLHSQTNHSDGGGDLSTCNGAEGPQDGAFGPADAYAYADAQNDRGLDFLMASEHNHLYDGSTSTNASADPAAAIALYNAGLAIATQYNTDHAGNFLALYGMEWGVTTNGGHLNILGASGLYEWEYTNGGQLIGSVYTPKDRYDTLYTVMRSEGALGQFNHPSSTTQFLVGSTALGYTEDGDAVMVLTEVLNTSAFSVNTTETETSNTPYESAWKKMLERGFHVAPASNQDNHCANWGLSYTNRTAVLIPDGTPLSMASFVEALRARRVFATMDRTGQIIFTANGHLMGSRIVNVGPLELSTLYASTSGHSVDQVQIYEGVPGRNGTVTVAASTATATLTPSVGHHFYYARIVQDDDDMLWSAPIWVEQLDPADVIFRDGF
ncbi:CehA/McbA family metallohydrolase [Tahibacter amnicola]|uniref:CehA/McbA family metallohydrolase n=1 Tax=Tahibacter amnicola TaxID=2976241 RepID=A0ABY6BJK4_9GAMM|nr:CehA/McbA family metallohydrolase [Tahibacter amnicola]UXI70064.1 CehA/McbA family metallohydrolase [Tahibacter amnicola]